MSRFLQSLTLCSVLCSETYFSGLTHSTAIDANRIPYTPINETAREYRIPREKSERARPGPNGKNESDILFFSI